MLANRLRAVYFWLLIFVTTMTSYVFVLAVDIVRALTRDEHRRAAHWLASVWGRSIIWLMPGWKITISGREHLPVPDTPVVMVANHESMADIWAMYSLGLQFRWLGKAMIFKLPVLGHAMKAAGYVPVQRGNRQSHEAALKCSETWIKRGISMFFFPEGTRSETAELKPFKIGAFKVARACGVPVLPIAIRGAGELLPKGSAMPRSAHVRVTVLPMMFDDPSESLEAFAERVRTQIGGVHKRLKEQES